MRRLRETPGKEEKCDDGGEGVVGSGDEGEGELGEEVEEEGTGDPQTSVTQSGLPASWSPSKSSGKYYQITLIL